jgi:hypothetical protein
MGRWGHFNAPSLIGDPVPNIIVGMTSHRKDKFVFDEFTILLQCRVVFNGSGVFNDSDEAVSLVN